MQTVVRWAANAFHNFGFRCVSTRDKHSVLYRSRNFVQKRISKARQTWALFARRANVLAAEDSKNSRESALNVNVQERRCERASSIKRLSWPYIRVAIMLPGHEIAQRYDWWWRIGKPVSHVRSETECCDLSHWEMLWKKLITSQHTIYERALSVLKNSSLKNCI